VEEESAMTLWPLGMVMLLPVVSGEASSDGSHGGQL
jgi:hypothetical protein